MSGRVFGLGVGPGDPELLTLKALARLRAAPVVAYPAPETRPELRARHRRALDFAGADRDPDPRADRERRFAARYGL